MSTTVDRSSITAREQRRLGREKRRDLIGSGEATSVPSRRDDSPGEGSAASDQARGRAKHLSPAATALVGATVGVLAAVVAKKKTRNEGNEISGDVAVHLLNKLELLTIRLQVRQARRAGPAEIDVHRVRADATSQP